MQPLINESSHIENDENKTISMSQVEQQHGNIKLGDVSYRSWRLGSLYNNESIYRNGEPLRESFGSNCTELDLKKTLSSLVSNKFLFGTCKTIGCINYH